MPKAKIKISKEDQLVENILKKIKKQSKEKEEIIEKRTEPESAKPKAAEELKKLRVNKEKIEQKKQKPLKSIEDLAKEFMESMSEREEQYFNEMTEAVNIEKEKDRIENLVCYIKKHKKKIPERLLLHLNYFPSLYKYFLLAEAEIKGKGKFKIFSKDKKSYFKLFPKGTGVVKTKIKMAPRRNIRKIRQIEKKIAKEYYIHIDDPTPEEKQAIKNLLEISEEFQKLYDEYKKLKFS